MSIETDVKNSLNAVNLLQHIRQDIRDLAAASHSTVILLSAHKILRDVVPVQGDILDMHSAISEQAGNRVEARYELTANPLTNSHEKTGVTAVDAENASKLVDTTSSLTYCLRELVKSSSPVIGDMAIECLEETVPLLRKMERLESSIRAELDGPEGGIAPKTSGINRPIYRHK